ncbi:MAG: hypothetical protein COA70_13240 [Planctomycetota bacterium]|nr:MAG: hypothetical protein COA70_13240 [Planctomycetota bacterium]
MVERLLYRYKEASLILGISPSTLKRAVAKGQIQAILAPGTVGPKGMRVSANEIARYIKTAERSSPTMAQWRRAKKVGEQRRRDESA